jgi:hypothetical protein
MNFKSKEQEKFFKWLQNEKGFNFYELEQVRLMIELAYQYGSRDQLIKDKKDFEEIIGKFEI